MSLNIIRRPIVIPQGINIQITDSIKINNTSTIIVIPKPKKVQLNIKDNLLFISGVNLIKKEKALPGSIWRIIHNYIRGLQQPWSIKLKLQGTGFNVVESDGELVLTLGKSHKDKYAISSNIVKYTIISPTEIMLSSYDKNILQNEGHRIASLRKVNPYSQRGIAINNRTYNSKEVSKK